MQESNSKHLLPVLFETTCNLDYLTQRVENSYVCLKYALLNSVVMAT